MPNKKTVKRNKRNSKRSKRSRSRKGGFFGFFDDKHNEGCDPNNLVNLNTSIEMHSEYQKCCPKTWYGRKNNSPYCKQLDSKFNEEQNKANMDAKMNKELITSTFTPDGDNGITLNAVINCKKPELYTTKEEIQSYIETCECNKTRWNPFSEKKANCAIVKPKLEKLQAEERPTEVFNPIQQNNQYMPIGQSDNDNEAEAQERPTEVTNPYPKNEYVQPQEQPEDQNQRPSLYSPEGGKRRKTKKHFNKRSIRKRKGRKSRKY